MGSNKSKSRFASPGRRSDLDHLDSDLDLHMQAWWRLARDMSPLFVEQNIKLIHWSCPIEVSHPPPPDNLEE